MSGWDSYTAVYGAELRASAHQFVDHGWPVIEPTPSTLLLVTGSVLDVLEVPAAVGRRVCAQLRDAGAVVPVAATPTGAWMFPVQAGTALPAELRTVRGLRLHTAGATVLAPPSEMPDGWVHWRVAPDRSGYRLPSTDTIFPVVTGIVRWQADHDLAGTQRPGGALVIGTRSS